ncbi:MAG: Fe-S-containing hydro-lyase [Holophagaceae bacterium]|nr:Fe-S-containing hydro-lyase [Holophagaceae bacterium]
MAIRQIQTPLTSEAVSSLNVGDEIRLSGTIYTARDQAHKRICALIDEGAQLPMDINGAVIYFAGPTPTPPDKPVGSAGPTTAYRMDAFSPKVIEAGLKGMIGKGNRSPEVIDAMKAHGAVYFAATGGAGALIAQCIKKSTCIAYEELGPEAIYKMEVEDFPMLVAIDSRGGNLYITGPEQYRETK